MSDSFSSRDVSRLLEDIYAAVMDVQSTRSPTVKAMGVLNSLHSRGWQVVSAEPIVRVPMVALVDEARDDTFNSFGGLTLKEQGL